MPARHAHQWEGIMDWIDVVLRLLSWQNFLIIIITTWGYNFHLRILEIQKQHREVIALLREISAKT